MDDSDQWIGPTAQHFLTLQRREIGPLTITRKRKDNKDMEIKHYKCNGCGIEIQGLSAELCGWTVRACAPPGVRSDIPDEHFCPKCQVKKVKIYDVPDGIKLIIPTSKNMDQTSGIICGQQLLTYRFIAKNYDVISNAVPTLHIPNDQIGLIGCTAGDLEPGDIFVGDILLIDGIMPSNIIKYNLCLFIGDIDVKSANWMQKPGFSNLVDGGLLATNMTVYKVILRRDYK